MPRSVIIVSSDPKLFDAVRTALGADDRFMDGGGALHCDGVVAPLTNIYPTTMAAADWDGWDDGPGGVPDPRAMTALVFECRSPAWVAEVGRVLATGLTSTAWFIDAADTAWPAGAIDPDRIALA